MFALASLRMSRIFHDAATRRSGYEPPVSHVKLLVAPSNSLREEAREPHHERKRVAHRQERELRTELAVLHPPHSNISSHLAAQHHVGGDIRESNRQRW